jgi:hypothetical protein
VVASRGRCTGRHRRAGVPVASRRSERWLSPAKPDRVLCRAAARRQKSALMTDRLSRDITDSRDVTGQAVASFTHSATRVFSRQRQRPDTCTLQSPRRNGEVTRLSSLFDLGRDLPRLYFVTADACRRSMQGDRPVLYSMEGRL